MKTKVNIIFILDRSGSMGDLASDVIGGYNTFIDNQRNKEGDAYVSTIIFDNEVKVLYDQKPIEEIKKLTSKEYYVRGTTALLDAIGITLSKYKNVQADHHLVVINTDGYENASSEYTYKQINKMINALQEEGWEFIFMGTRIDAIKEAGKIGIHESRAVNYDTSDIGLSSTFDVINDITNNLRNNQRLEKHSSEWKKKIR